MALLDYATIIGRAAWVRHRAGLIGAAPPYSMRHVMETVFPEIPVAGTTLPDGIIEMAVVDRNRRALFYARKVNHPAQRTGLAHGLYHHLSDLKDTPGIRECNIPFRKMARFNPAMHNHVELACDLFAAELLIPVDVLHEYAPESLFPRDQDGKDRVSDETDNLASRFNVPVGFMRWRLHDLSALRRSHYNTEY